MLPTEKSSILGYLEITKSALNYNPYKNLCINILNRRVIEDGCCNDIKGMTEYLQLNI